MHNLWQCQWLDLDAPGAKFEKLHLQMVLRLEPGLCICADAALQSMGPCGSHYKAVHCLSIAFASNLVASARVMCRCGMVVYGAIWLRQRATCTGDDFPRCTRFL